MNNDNKSNKGEEVKKNMAKKAATAYAGPLGGKAVDLASKTKLGKAALQGNSDLINKNPGMPKGMPGLPKMGNKPKEEGLPKGDLEGEDSKPKLPGSKDNKSKSPLSNLGNNNKNDSTETDELYGTDTSQIIFAFIKKYWKQFAAVAAGVVMFLIVLLAIPIIVSSIGGGVIEFFSKVGDSLIGFVETDEKQQKLIKKYYDELEKVQNDRFRKTKHNVCIDVNLITATLTVNVDAQDYTYLEEQTPNDEHKPYDMDGVNTKDVEEGDSADEAYRDENGVTETDKDLKKMKKEVGILANMQIKNVKYGVDKDVKTKQKDCRQPDEEPEYELVTEDNLERLDLDGFNNFLKFFTSYNKKIEKYVSDSPEKVAKHDLSNFQRFFTKKVDEEKNYEYRIYIPAYYEDVKTKSLKCDRDKTPDDQPELSIGDLNTMKESVYYWNLVNSFIPNYYNKYLPVDEPKRTEAIEKIAEDIYLLYNDLGPSQSCKTSSTTTTNIYSECPNGITVDGVGSIDLEEYVAGVVSHEAYCNEGMEALKAQAVAARSYALAVTNNCQKSIENSTNYQTFTLDINDRAREAAYSTAGEVMTYNGSVFLAQYDSFCYADNDCPDATKNSDGTYSVTYTKMPNGETHVITLSDSAQYGRILPGQGHAHGMSQLVSYQMAKEGNTYTEILAYFYSDDASLGKLSPRPKPGGSKDERIAALFPLGLPQTEAEMAQYLTTISVPAADINGNIRQVSVTLHKDLAQDFLDIMTTIANHNVPIKDVGCYNWRSAAASSSRSQHSYGVACDLNSNENYMIKDGAIISGSYWRPGDDPYSFPADGIVVTTFNDHGWTWGGSWSSSKDYMHFSYLGG